MRVGGYENCLYFLGNAEDLLSVAPGYMGGVKGKPPVGL